jgi:peptidyl-prolyl cis-trans isomerase C
MENKVLAIVNGKEITQNDLDIAISRFPGERQGYFRNEEGKKQLLDQMVSFELIYNYAKDNGIEQEQDYIERLEAAKKVLLTQTAINKILSEVRLTDDEIKAYYDVNKELFKTEEAANARHILVNSLEEANEIRSKIVEGMNFEMAAMQYSTCPSKAQGGNLGQFTRGRMVPEFEDAAFKLEVGAISEPVKTQFGYHLIKVENKSEASVKPLEEVYSVIKSELLNQRESYKYMQFTEGLKDKYKVEIK